MSFQWQLCGANWKLYIFVSTKKCTLIHRGTCSGMSQNRIALSAILNVCLSALLDWGHVVQHLAGLNPRCWAQLKSLPQLYTSKGFPYTMGILYWIAFMETARAGNLVIRPYWFNNCFKASKSFYDVWHRQSS